ncbi:MAG: hypothetical protein HUU22_05110 [Phycisphaerae bacterium]|nr:hypothetical protein [Phycisphaerae bacterium]NUQ45392.1 hypothetical protein [Phycisphaerae bacterium]
MFIRSKILVAASLMVPTAALVSSARADILDQILDGVNTAINRATQARDRAIEARNNAADARDRAQEIKDTIQQGVQTLSQQVRDVITEAIEDAERLVAEELAGRDEFINGPECAEFRQDLVTLLQRLENLLNALQSIANPLGTPDVSFQDEIQLIQGLPCRALFPLYRVATAADFLSQELLDRLDEATTAINLLADVLGNYVDVAGGPLDYELGQAANQYILDHPTLVNGAVLTVRGLSMSTKALGKRLQSKGHTGLAAVKVQIHGYMGVSLANDAKMKYGTILVGLSDMLGQVANSASSQVNHVMLIGALDELRDNHEAILAQHQQLIGQVLANQAIIIENQNQMKRDLQKILKTVQHEQPLQPLP